MKIWVSIKKNTYELIAGNANVLVPLLVEVEGEVEVDLACVRAHGVEELAQLDALTTAARVEAEDSRREEREVHKRVHDVSRTLVDRQHLKLLHLLHGNLQEGSNIGKKWDSCIAE